jgi:demethoxyubiquinone hydroxylase (CLK1/Coq7/Cat5 family)
MRRLPKKMLRLPLEKRAAMAFKEAVEAVIEEHSRLKLPLHIWRKGKVVALSARQMRRVGEATTDR